MKDLTSLKPAGIIVNISYDYYHIEVWLLASSQKITLSHTSLPPTGNSRHCMADSGPERYDRINVTETQ